MSWIFDKVFEPSIKNLLQSNPLLKNQQNESNFISSKQKASSNRTEQNSKQKNLNKPNPMNIFSLNIFMDAKDQDQGRDTDKSSKIKQKQRIFFNEEENSLDLENHSKNYSINSLPTDLKKHCQQLNKISDFPEEMTVQSAKCRKQLQESLIKNASCDKQSERLQIIFESARKHKASSNSKSSNNQVSNKKRFSFSKDIRVGEVSRKLLRRSFCLKMIEDDQEWQNVVSNQFSKNSKLKQQTQKDENQ